MDYIKLRNRLNANKIGIAGLFKKLNMSRGSFYYMIEKQTLKVETLEKICEALNMPITDFFEIPPDQLKENTEKYHRPESEIEKELLNVLRELNVCRKEKEALQMQLLNK